MNWTFLFKLQALNTYYRVLLIFLFYSISNHSFCLTNKPISHFDISKKDSVIQQKTALIDHKRYTAISTRIFNDTSAYEKFYIRDESGKTIFKYPDDEVLGFTFTDFNGDGYKDIIVEIRGVDSGGQDLIIYDPKSKKFTLAGSCSNARKIIGTKYYYSYEDCCLGRDWSSNLFYISDSKIINTGCIEYNDGFGLSFYKIKGQKKILLKKWRVRINGDTPVLTGLHIDFNLKHYWTKHWSSFK